MKFSRQGFVVIMLTAVVMMPSSVALADVITIDDGGQPGFTDIPFTCVLGSEGALWLPSMGFVYRNVEAFELSVGDTIAFDIQMRSNDSADLGFLPQLDIALAHASDPQQPFIPDVHPGRAFTVVAHAAIAARPGNRAARDYELAFTADAPFSFPGGGLIIRVNNPEGPLATKRVVDCLPVITADMQPTGSNRLVGIFKLDDGEYPWATEVTVNPGVPYVRISWTRCGDGIVSGSEVCDDGNTDNTDGCTNSCLPARCGDGIVASTEECDDGNTDNTDGCTNSCHVAACGDGIVQKYEECDNSAHLDNPDPFCDDTCHLVAFAKGSGCSTGGGAGLAVMLAALAFACRRRTSVAAVLVVGLWAGSVQAQVPSKTEGFRVDRFEMAPSVDDGLVVQDPGALRHLSWSVSSTLGFTNTLLQVVPKLSSDTGVDVVGSRLSAYLDFAMGLRDRFEVNVAVPFVVAQASESGTAAGIMLRGAGTSAVGDARVGGAVLLYGQLVGPQLGLAATVSLPIGSTASFTGDGRVGAEILAEAGFVRPGYRVTLNTGMRLRHEVNYVTSDQGTELIGRAGIFVPVANQRLMTSLEFDLSSRVSGHDAYRALGSPVLPILGARYHFAGGVRAGAGVGMGLTDAPGSPAVRVLVTVGYSPESGRQKFGLVPQSDDRDGDGIVDSLDKCPSEPEDFNGFEDDDGCPDAGRPPAVVTPPLTLEQVVTLPSPIEFKFDTAIMLPGAEVYLFQVLDILQHHPEVLKLEIQGHTSSEGGPEYNMKLSDARSWAVFTWLVDHGIEGQRLVPRGYGLTVPLVPNDSEQNRQRNRRVQFHLLEQVSGSPLIGS